MGPVNRGTENRCTVNLGPVNRGTVNKGTVNKGMVNRDTVNGSLMLLISGSSAGPEKCPEAGTCSECMTAHYTCMWCKDEDYTESRCQSNSTTPESGFLVCQNWTFPVSSTEETAQDFNDTVQVKPTRIKISNLRPGLIWYLGSHHRHDGESQNFDKNFCTVFV